MGKIKRVFLFLTMVVFVVDIVLMITLVKSNDGDEDEAIINVPSYDYEIIDMIEIPTKDTSIWEPDSPDKGVIINIDYYNQDNFPTFCEGVTTLMALRYMGYDITIDQLIDEYVPTFQLTQKNGTLIGEDPNLYFIGNPRSSDANGCYAPVIKNILIEIAGESAVHDLTGMDVEDIITQYVNKGIPVIFWATMEMKESTVGQKWYIERTGETFTWKGREHCLLLAGSDSENYYFYDPLDNHGIIAYDKELVVQRYEEMGKMAIALVKRADGN